MSSRQKSKAQQGLDARLKAAQAKRKSGKGRDKQTGELGMALKVAVDLVAGVGVGVAIGLGLDFWLGTRPWMLILFFVLGSAAGIRNVFRTAKELEGKSRSQVTRDKD